MFVITYHNFPSNLLLVRYYLIKIIKLCIIKLNQLFTKETFVKPTIEFCRIKIGSLRKLTRQGDKQKLSRQLVYEQSESNNHWLSLASGAETPNQRFQYFTTYVGDNSNTCQQWKWWLSFYETARWRWSVRIICQTCKYNEQSYIRSKE